MHVHVSSYKQTFLVFGALLVLTVLTTVVASIDFGAFNDVIAMGIAITKAVLVALYFMHLRWSTPTMVLVAITSVLFLLILFTFTLADYLTRDAVLGW